jgi:hypothetical protein
MRPPSHGLLDFKRIVESKLHSNGSRRRPLVLGPNAERLRGGILPFSKLNPSVILRLSFGYYEGSNRVYLGKTEG